MCHYELTLLTTKSISRDEVCLHFELAIPAFFGQCLLGVIFFSSFTCDLIFYVWSISLMNSVQLVFKKNTSLIRQFDLLNDFQFSSVAQLCLTLCDPINRSTPGLPVHHQLPEFTQTHVHWVGDAIRPSHPLLSPSPPAPNPSHIRVFSNESTLHMRWPKYWSFSFSISPSNEHLGLFSFKMDWLDLLEGLSRVFSNTTVQKHQFFGAQPSSQSNSHIHTWPLEKP